jgi:hypothetical protein
LARNVVDILRVCNRFLLIARKYFASGAHDARPLLCGARAHHAPLVSRKNVFAACAFFDRLDERGCPQSALTRISPRVCSQSGFPSTLTKNLLDFHTQIMYDGRINNCALIVPAPVRLSS